MSVKKVKNKKAYKDTLSNCTPQPSKTTSKTNKVVPKSINQKNYLQAIEEKDLVIGVGPAGSGKSFLAMAMAVSYYLQGKVKRIILIRPAVEAGEKLGYLPGSVIDKIDPYMRCLYDSMYALLEPEKVDQLLESGIIELAPVGFLRGRTLTDSFVVGDEFQNTTVEQMKMIVTRLGFGSKMVINGDPGQVDLPKHIKSGLLDAQEVLAEVPGVAICQFYDSDIVRCPLVKAIVTAYESRDSN